LISAHTRVFSGVMTLVGENAASTADDDADGPVRATSQSASANNFHSRVLATVTDDGQEARVEISGEGHTLAHALAHAIRSVRGTEVVAADVNDAGGDTVAIFRVRAEAGGSAMAQFERGVAELERIADEISLQFVAGVRHAGGG
jgi:DNA-directed RNA polymerase subunit L